MVDTPQAREPGDNTPVPNPAARIPRMRRPGEPGDATGPTDASSAGNYDGSTESSDEAAPTPVLVGSAKHETVMDLLAGHVPLSLIMDLAMPAGPHSRELLHDEGSSLDPWWEPH